jgi:hypothetical protein
MRPLDIKNQVVEVEHDDVSNFFTVKLSYPNAYQAMEVVDHIESLIEHGGTLMLEFGGKKHARK